VVEEPEGVHGDTAGAPGEMLLPEHVDQVRLDLLGRELIGGAMIVPGQAGHGRQIGLARPLSHPPDEHGVVHARHGAPPVSVGTATRTPTTGVPWRRLWTRGTRSGRPSVRRARAESTTSRDAHKVGGWSSLPR
jgi:hypothetical protein